LKIVLATSNRGKIEEFKEYLKGHDVVSFGEIMDEFEIEESGSSFKENAIIKAKEVAKRIDDDLVLVISDDSGLSVPTLDFEPGIFSSRYAGADASMTENKQKLIKRLKSKGISKTDPFYTAAIAIVYKGYTFSVHGWMFGSVIDKEIGSNGFGYDPLFIPFGEAKTLGELDSETKQKYSHRVKALKRALKIIESL